MGDTMHPRQAYVLTRGVYSNHGEPVTPRGLNQIFPYAADLPPDRLGLAQWLFDVGNPLTARVYVNRLWQLHFGRGLVSTAEEFGTQGEAPTHPELLDWLARRFVDSGWDIKALNKLIVMSATYRQDSTERPGDAEQDPDEPLARARRRAAAVGRDDSRQRPCGRRSARSDGRRPERLSVSTRRCLGSDQLLRAIRRLSKTRGPAARPAPAQPLLARAPRRARAVDDDLRFPAPAHELRYAGRHRARRCKRSCCSTIRNTSKRRAVSPPAS